MKWRALTHGFRETDVLYLDTDTVATGDVGQLFERQGPEDFHARREIASEAEATAYPYLVGTLFVDRSQIDHRLFADLCRSLGAAVRPLWNTGVMVFRNGLAGRLAGRWDDFARLRRLLWRKFLPYPCSNPHILEEVVASLVLGRVDPLTWAFLPRQAASWFLEYMGREGGEPVLVHTWSACYPSYLCVAGQLDALRAYQALPGGGRPRGAPGAMRLSLGTSRWPVPKWALERWLGFGAASFLASARRPGRPSRFARAWVARERDSGS